MGSGQSKDTTQTVYQATSTPWTEYPAQDYAASIKQAQYIPYSSYPYTPRYVPGYGWTGEYVNTLTGQLDPQYSATSYTMGNRPAFQSTIAAQPAETQQGLQALIQRAISGSPILNAAQTNLADTLSGKYLAAESNPYLSGMYDAAARSMMQKYTEGVQPEANAMFNRAGAFGGTAHRLYQAQQARDLQQGLGDLASSMYGTAYGDERQRQLQAALVGPQIAQADYADIQALLSAGDIKQQYEQQRLNEMREYWQNAANWPFSSLSWMGQQYGVPLGTPTSTGTITTTEMANPYYTSPASKLMGGLTSGTGLGTMIGMASGSPILGALGGLGGLLSGLL